jgi:hypothetical protein
VVSLRQVAEFWQGLSVVQMSKSDVNSQWGPWKPEAHEQV